MQKKTTNPTTRRSVINQGLATEFLCPAQVCAQVTNYHKASKLLKRRNDVQYVQVIAKHAQNILEKCAQIEANIDVRNQKPTTNISLNDVCNYILNADKRSLQILSRVMIDQPNSRRAQS